LRIALIVAVYFDVKLLCIVNYLFLAWFTIYVIFILITHAGCVAAGVDRAFSRVCLFLTFATGMGREAEQR